MTTLAGFQIKKECANHVVSLKKLYFSMLHSHISYCINVYGSANQTNLSKLEVQQNSQFAQSHMLDVENIQLLYSRNKKSCP